MKPYNPLATENLGASVAEALLEREPEGLEGLEAFNGAGLYAVYYVGDFPSYAAIAKANRNGAWRWPIYVGKAMPAGARKALTGGGVGRSLHKRLNEHAKRIIAAPNLNISDFACRYLVAESVWIPLGESLLIAKFAPLWNRVLDGFGNHPPGEGRSAGMPSRWDTVHPGRAVSPKSKARPETPEMLLSEVEERLRSTTPPPARPPDVARCPHDLFEEPEAE